jgi:hypothetical protein
MNKRIIIFGVLFILIILVWLMIKNSQNEFMAQDNIENFNDTTILNESIPEFNDDKELVYFGNNSNFYGYIIKDKINKRANINATFSFSDDEEKSEVLGKDYFLAPAVINMMCNLLNVMSFDKEMYEQMQQSSDNLIFSKNAAELYELNPDENHDFIYRLGNYSIISFSIIFIDFEDDSLIAKCESTGNENLTFSVYKDYDPEESIFNTIIGEFQ